MATQETYYRPGLLFLSRFANLQMPIKEPEFFIHTSGEREMVKPGIVISFGDDSLATNEYRDGEGNLRADVRGGAFDLDQSAEFYGWSEEDRELVARKMLRRVHEPGFTDFELYEVPIPVAPWPTYDDNAEGRIPQLAAELDLVRPALDYERATLNRPKVVEALAKKIEKETEESELEEE